MNCPEEKLDKKLPQRPRAHILGYYAEHFVISKLPPEWIARTVSYDYGLDLNVEIVRDHSVTGMNFSVQVKALTKDPGRSTDITVRLRIQTVAYMHTRLEPVILVVFVEELEEAFWCWASDIPEGRGHSVVAHVPRNQTLSATDWNAFASVIEHLIAGRPAIDLTTSERLVRFGRYSIDLSHCRLLFKEEVDDLESLVNEERVRESELQKFMERHPNILDLS